MPAASGVKYEAPGELVVFWSKGDQATLQAGSAGSRSCRLAGDGATQPDYVALGQEPGWRLEIREGDRITFLSDYGRVRVVTPAPEPQASGQGRRYEVRTEAHSLQIVSNPARCTESMSGEAFEERVTVILDGRRFTGCGPRFMAAP